MKYKVITVVGIAAMLLLTCVLSAIVLYNYGRTGLGIYNPYYDLGEFSWGTIDRDDCIGWGLSTLWFFLLAIPWVQYFVAIGKHQRIRYTLSARNGFFDVLFTVFNVSLFIGVMFLLVKGGNEDDMRFGYDRLIYVLTIAGSLYVLWAIFVIVRNFKRRNIVCGSQVTNHEPEKNRVWHWIISCVMFIVLAVYCLDGWYNWRYDFCCGRASQCIDGKWGYIDRLHRVTVPHVYDNAWDFSDGLACVGIRENGNDKYGYIDRHGNIDIPLIYDSPADFINGVAYVKKNDKHGTINSDGKELVPIIYDSVGFMFSENKGLSRVKFQGRVGFVRRNGDVVIPIVYEDAEYYFNEDLVRVKLYDKWGYLDCKGDVVIPMIYDEAGNFKDGRAEVQIEGEKFYIDVNGLKL